MGLNTVKRVFASVRSVINLNIREYGLEGNNAFSGTYMPDRDDASPSRKPIPNDILQLIQKRCMETDDEARWLVALISDTGMRLSEAAGLSKEDIHLDVDIPYVEIRPNKWRRLKTKSSIRKLHHWSEHLYGPPDRLLSPAIALLCSPDIAMKQNANLTLLVLH